MPAKVGDDIDRRLIITSGFQSKLPKAASPPAGHITKTLALVRWVLLKGRRDLRCGRCEVFRGSSFLNVYVCGAQLTN